MLRQGFVAAVMACAFGWPAEAQTADAHDFMNGVYASSKKDCAALAKGGMSAIEDGAVLTSEGLKAYEYFCEFVDVKPRPGANKGWVATGFCEEPDDQYPELVAIAPFGEDFVRAIFLTDFTLGGDDTVSGGGKDVVGGGEEGDDDGNISPPSEQAAKLKGVSEPGGDDQGGDDQGGGDQGGGDQGGGDQGGGVGPGGDDGSGTGDDDGGGVGDDGGGGDEANFNEFFFCAGVSKDKLK